MNRQSNSPQLLQSTPRVEVTDFSPTLPRDDSWQRHLQRFETLVRQFEPVVFPICLLLTGDDDMADRLCEDAFVDVFRSGCETTSSATEFLHAVLGRVLDLTRPKVMPLDLDTFRNLRFWDLMSKMTVEDREILVLRFVGRLNLEEIAKILGVNDLEIRSRIWVAMRRLDAGRMGAN